MGFSLTGSLCPEVSLQGAKQATWAGGGVGALQDPGESEVCLFLRQFHSRPTPSHPEHLAMWVVLPS